MVVITFEMAQKLVHSVPLINLMDAFKVIAMEKYFGRKCIEERNCTYYRPNS